MEKKCIHCNNTLTGKQRKYCSEAHKKAHKYATDSDYRDRQNEARADRMRLQRDRDRRTQERLLLIQAMTLYQQGLQ